MVTGRAEYKRSDNIDKPYKIKNKQLYKYELDEGLDCLDEK